MTINSRPSIMLVILLCTAVLLVLVLMMARMFRDPVIMQPIVNRVVIPPRSETCKEQERDREAAAAPLMNQSVAPDDPRLVEAIRNHFLDPPSNRVAKMSLPLFKTPQAEVVDKILHQKEMGFFIECGALDGERSSNTIFFEQKRGWTGLLIEMDPSWYLQLRGKNRKSFSINACISPHQYPIKMDFKEHTMGEGKLVKSSTGVEKTVRQASSEANQVRPVYCFPLYSVLLALNQTHIDYFSLDVEGFELDILKTIPFDKLDISVFSVEYAHAKDGEAYKQFMEKKGYTLHSRVEKYRPEIYFGCKDYIFVKKGLTLF